MKFLNTALLILAIGGIAANFYFDHIHYVKLDEQLTALSKTKVVEMPAVADPSPFDRPMTEQSINNEEVPKGPQTSIQFPIWSHDFGNIKTGKVYATTFQFKNTGANNLIISEAIGSCGCTVPTWPKEAVAPGQSAEIKVEFDAKGREGKQTKTVTVTSNTIPSKNVLTITANVIPQ